MQIYVLDADLETVGLIDAYRSLIWTSRYVELGDCELYVPATTENIQLLQIGRYLQRLDDDMICRIRKRELQTDVENGDYLIVTGEDAKGILDQRIIWDTMYFKSTAESAMRQMVIYAVTNGDVARRIYKSDGTTLLFKLAPQVGFTEWFEAQASYENVGEKIREICKQNGYGYKTPLDNGKLAYTLYKGTDRSDTVIFSEDYENLATTDYIEDWTNMGNVAMAAGQGEGAQREKTVVGTASGINRYEIYADLRNLSNEMSSKQLNDIFPGFIRTIDGGTTWVKYAYQLDVPYFTDTELAELEENYPGGTTVTDDNGNKFYRLINQNIADWPYGQAIVSKADDSIALYDIAYKYWVFLNGGASLAEYGAVTSFSGEIEPNVTFEYKKDYFLGDLVTVESPYGVSAAVRITEVLEVDDENGYRVEPIFEYKTEV